MTEQSSDPRARFRRLPEPVRPEDAVETEPAGPSLPAESPADA